MQVQAEEAQRLAVDYDAAPPDVALQNGGAIRSGIVLPAGPIRLLDTFDMAPFSNLVTVLENISREQFKEVLENAVSRAVEGDTEGGTGRFAQVSGFSFEWSESGTAQVLDPDGWVEVEGTRVQRVKPPPRNRSPSRRMFIFWPNPSPATFRGCMKSLQSS